MGIRSEAELLAMFVFSIFTEEVTEQEARAILLATGEISDFEVDEVMDELLVRGVLYSVSETDGRYLGMTEKGEEAVEALYDKRELFSSLLSKALLEYKRITEGIEYSVALKDGDRVVDFRMTIHSRTVFSTSLTFGDSLEALAAYNRLNGNPEAFYKGVMTIASGSIDYLK